MIYLGVVPVTGLFIPDVTCFGSFPLCMEELDTPNGVYHCTRPADHQDNGDGPTHVAGNGKWTIGVWSHEEVRESTSLFAMGIAFPMEFPFEKESPFRQQQRKEKGQCAVRTPNGEKTPNMWRCTTHLAKGYHIATGSYYILSIVPFTDEEQQAAFLAEHLAKAVVS